MRTLSRIGFNNEQHFTTLAGVRFRGVLYPTNDQTLQSLTFISQRHLLRTRPNEPVTSRDMFTDAMGRIFLLAENDRRRWANHYLVFQMTEQFRWTSSAPGGIHPVTRERMNDITVDKGLIWCAVENMVASRDGGTNVLVDRDRIITGADIKLGDRLNGRKVRELNKTLGVSVAVLE